MTIAQSAGVALKDPNKALWLFSPLVPIMALFYLGLGYWTGQLAFYWAFPVVIYVFIPVTDWLVGRNTRNPSAALIDAMERDPYYPALVYAFVPFQFIVTGFGAWVIAMSPPLPWWAIFGLALSVGVVNGVGFIAAHELTHKKNALDRWLAKLSLAPTAYGHFFAEHVRGHHKNVATPGDPTSSLLGESFWRYLPRAMLTGIVSAWRIERDRLQRQGRSTWIPANENLHTWAMTVALFGGLVLWLGWIVFPFLLAQAAYGIILLEVTNYIEHYGLLRKKLPNGNYEPCSPAHAWDSNHFVCTLFLFQLQRHADHHSNPGNRYQSMRCFDGTPQLPASYVTMMLVAYVPPLWYRVMDHRVAAHYNGDLSQAHVHPSRRAALGLV